MSHLFIYLFIHFSCASLRGMNKSCRTEKIQRECRSDGRTDCVCVCVCSYVKLRGVCVECVRFFSSLPFAVCVSSCISLMQAKEADDGGAHRWMTYRLCRLCHGDTSCKPPRSNMRPDWLLRLEVSRVTRVLEGSNQGNRAREKKKAP